MILSIDGIEYNLEVDHIYHRPEYGSRVDGLQMEPDIPAHVEITSVKMEVGRHDWQEVILPDQVIHDIERELMRDYE